MKNPDILLVEDDPIDAKFFSRAIGQVNPDIRVLWLANGREALNYIQDMIRAGVTLPRLIVLDIKLPGLKGFEVLACLREEESTKTLPIVMMSSSTQKTDIETAYTLGANSYLNKPQTYSKLNQVLTYLVSYWLDLNKSTHSFR